MLYYPVSTSRRTNGQDVHSCLSIIYPFTLQYYTRTMLNHKHYTTFSLRKQSDIFCAVSMRAMQKIVIMRLFLPVSDSEGMCVHYECK